MQEVTQEKIENEGEKVNDKDNKQTKPKKDNKTLKKILVIILLLLLLGGASYGGYWYCSKDAKQSNADKQTQIDKLNQEKADLQKQVDEAKADAAKDEAVAVAEADKTPSEDTLGNIEDSITSGNTAALEGYMASKVNVILAASECCGSRTPAQAVSDIAYLEGGTDPWDFSLPQATLDGYAASPYSQYFPEDALVGKSANGYLVSFTFDADGEIDGVFMSNSADL